MPSIAVSPDGEHASVSTGNELDMDEWRQICLEVDKQLRLKDFVEIEKLGRALCVLRPNRARGWSLRHLAMKHLQTSKESLATLVQEGIAACEGGHDAEKLIRALQDMPATDIADMRYAAVGSDTQSQHDVQVFVGEWDDEGVFVYQAYNDCIADWALAHQQFGGPGFCPRRMTWIKPSFAWVLYRSGYGQKHGQTRILKIKLPHDALAEILCQCQCVDTNKATRKSKAHKDQDISNGRVQWDPERDLMSADGKEPRKLLRCRAIQIGLAGSLSEFFVKHIISIQDVTKLAHRVRQAHTCKKKDDMSRLLAELPLPIESPYMPHCPRNRLVELGMLPGDVASALSQIGRGKAV